MSFLLTALWSLVLVLTTVVASSSSSNDDDFLTLRAHCHSDRINVSLSTSEPFEGLVYARNHPSTCRSSGVRGRPVTWLHMTPDRRCGIRRVRQHSQGGTATLAREVDVYVQHDFLVQQVIDEQFLVRCLPGVEEGLVNYHQSRRRNRPRGGGGDPVVRDVTVTSKFGSSRTKKQRTVTDAEEEKEEEKRAGFVKEEKNIFANLVDSNLDVIAETPVWVEKSKEIHVLNRDASTEELKKDHSTPPPSLLPSHSSDPAASWMEIDWPGSDDGDDGDRLEEGDEITLSIRLRQSEGRDAAVGTCIAYSNDGFSLRLTDGAGCSLRPEAVPHLAAAFNSRTGVKALRTSFAAFRPGGGDDGRLSVRCQVLVCRGNCPVARCDDNGGREEKTEERKDEAGKVVDSYWLRTHVDVSEKKEEGEEKEKPVKKAVARARTAPIVEEEEAGMEAEEAYLEQELLHHHQVDESTANLVCVSPPRLLVAFSVLLLVLMLALVCACLLWVRARSTTAGAAAASAASAGRFLTVKTSSLAHPPPPPPPPLPGPRRGPLPPIMMQRRMPPYIRVMH